MSMTKNSPFFSKHRVATPYFNHLAKTTNVLKVLRKSITTSSRFETWGLQILNGFACNLHSKAHFCKTIKTNACKTII